MKLQVAITLLAALSIQLPALAQYKLYPWSRCAGGNCPQKSKPELSAEDHSLMLKLAKQPELMNVEYLKFLIGRPDNEKSQAGAIHKHYIWYDKARVAQYELNQTEPTPGSVVDSTLTVNVADAGLSFDNVDELFGDMSRRFYDYHGHPTKLFTFAPNTYLAFSSQPNSFTLNKARVVYRGDALPPPSNNDMQMAQAAMIARTASVTIDPDEPVSEETVARLRARIKTQPYDAQAHFQLGQALQRRCHLHEAIGQYKISLALSGNDPAVREQSLEALRQLKVIAPIPDRRANTEIVDNGQRLDTRGHEKRSKKSNQSKQTQVAADGSGT